MNLGLFTTLARGIRFSAEYADSYGAHENLPDIWKLWLALAVSL